MFSSAEITELLIDWSKGNKAALETLYPLVEKELHQMAHHYMMKLQPGNTLQTTAVINETYLRMITQDRVQWQNRAHFFAIAANMMRRVLLNHIRRHHNKKRGGGAIKVEFEESMVVTAEKSAEILALEYALVRLAEFDERKSKVVELRFYGGMSVSEIAVALNISEITVTRDWNMAKAWLAREIRDEN